MIDKQVKKILGKRIYVLSSDNDKHFTIRDLHLKDLEQFYYKWGEKIYAVNENLDNLIKYADNIMVNNLKKNTDNLKGDKDKICALAFESINNIDYIQFRYHANEKGKIARVYKHKD